MVKVSQNITFNQDDEPCKIEVMTVLLGSCVEGETTTSNLQPQQERLTIRIPARTQPNEETTEPAAPPAPTPEMVPTTADGTTHPVRSTRNQVDYCIANNPNVRKDAKGNNCTSLAIDDVINELIKTALLTGEGANPKTVKEALECEDREK
ncbi:hypothetical protein AMATHDRAFT_51870 [Amanita thiersii Skay4041]|uniref:Uncharacterized protein n=1 Tax=Amanita thiersii Skay4041 TaxID=703135 RepID=A0A2A9N6P7_9AGAR|nr:hypothetical protein AMATHDRAFT_51870 [Amanita thiersii Skay4041]